MIKKKISYKLLRATIINESGRREFANQGMKLISYKTDYHSKDQSMPIFKFNVYV